MPSYQTLFNLAVVVIGFLAGLVRKSDLDKIKTLEATSQVDKSDMLDRIRALEIRHEELEKTVDKNRDSTVESTHSIRTIIGTEYTTKAEFSRALERIDRRMDDGFKAVMENTRQLLNDTGLIKK